MLMSPIPRYSARALPNQSRAPWLLILGLILLGAYLRVITIDRGTPALGMIVYAGALFFFIGMIAVPIGLVGALFVARQWRSRLSTEWIRNGSAALAALTVFALHHIGHRSAPPQVWIVMSVLAFVAARSAYALGLTLLPRVERGSRATTRQIFLLDREQPTVTSAPLEPLSQRSAYRCAGDDRNLKWAWRCLLQRNS